MSVLYYTSKLYYILYLVGNILECLGNRNHFLVTFQVLKFPLLFFFNAKYEWNFNIYLKCKYINLKAFKKVPIRLNYFQINDLYNRLRLIDEMWIQWIAFLTIHRKYEIIKNASKYTFFEFNPDKDQFLYANYH